MAEFTEEAIAKGESDLPLMASVAFGVRCINRLLETPYFPTEFEARMRMSVECFADDTKLESDDSLRWAHKASHRALLSAGALSTKARKAVQRMETMTRDFVGTVNRLLPHVTNEGHRESREILLSLIPQVYAIPATELKSDHYEKVRQAILFDFQLIHTISKNEHWTMDTYVPQAFFGPLWPFGNPILEERHSNRQTPDNVPHVLRLEFAVPEGVDRHEADRLISEIIQNANQLHHAYGGSGLTIADGKVYECEPSLEPVGGAF